MPNSTTVIHESPRLGKGVNKRFAEDDGSQQAPKKKKTPPPEGANPAPNADDPPATTTNNKGLSTNQHYLALKAKADVWEKEDSQKTKKMLVLELVQTKKNEHTLDFNCKVWEQSQKKAVANFKAYKAKVEPQLKELRQLRAHMEENSDQAEQVWTLQNDLEF
jgi:hypothetical protein